MCLAPKVRHFNSTTKAPVDISRLKQLKHFLPPKSKTLKAKTVPCVAKIVEVAVKPEPEPSETVPRLAPRHDHEASLDAIFRESFGASPSGDIVLIPRVKEQSMAERPESPFIKRTLSFCSISSEVTTPTTNVRLVGSIYLYTDCRCEGETLDEGKEEQEYSYDEWDTKPAAQTGFSTPPVTHVSSLSPPPSPHPSSYFEKEVSFPKSLWLPAFP